MEKKIKCPKRNLERFLLSLNDINFKELGKEPSIEEAEGLARFLCSYGNGEETTEAYIKEAYRRLLRRKIKERRDAEELSIYGQTCEEILKNLKEHVRECHNCSKKYVEFITEGAVMLFQGSKKIISGDYPKELIDSAREEVRVGLYELLKQEDKRFLGLLE